MCVRRSRKARGVGTRARHKLSEYVLWLCGRYPFNFPKGFPEGLHPPGFPMGYTPLNSPRGFPEGLYPLEFPRACTLLNSPRSSPRAVLPVSNTLRCGLRGRPCRLRDASRHQGYNRSFSVLGAPRHQGATIKGGLFGLCPQPEGPPKPFLRCSPLLYLLWGAPRPQGATIHHHVSPQNQKGLWTSRSMRVCAMSPDTSLIRKVSCMTFPLHVPSTGQGGC